MNRDVWLIGFLVLSLAWTTSIFIAPLSLPPFAVSGLDGLSNRIDYGERWSSLPPYHRVVYSIGDLITHQKWDRSYTLNDNQLPVEARWTAISLFANLGLLTTFFLNPKESIVEMTASLFPRRGGRGRQTLLFAALLTLALLPIAFDGFMQLLTPYESTNLKRFLTGIPAGWMGGFLVGVTILSLREFRKRRIGTKV